MRMPARGLARSHGACVRGILSEPCSADNALSARGHTTRAARNEGCTHAPGPLSFTRTSRLLRRDAVMRGRIRFGVVRRTVTPREAALPI